MRRISYVLLVGLLAITFLVGCSNAKLPVAKDTVVSFNYTGKTSDGTVFDSTAGREPLTVIIGEKKIIPGLEKGLMGMKVGDKKTIAVAAADAYGPHRDDMVINVPMSNFPKDMELKEGMQLALQTPQGPLPAVVVKIEKDSVKMDFNPPLAGKDLTFDVQIVSVRKATADEISGKASVQPAAQPAQPATAQPATTQAK